MTPKTKKILWIAAAVAIVVALFVLAFSLLTGGDKGGAFAAVTAAAAAASLVAKQVRDRHEEVVQGKAEDAKAAAVEAEKISEEATVMMTAEELRLRELELEEKVREANK